VPNTDLPSAPRDIPRRKDADQNYRREHQNGYARRPHAFLLKRRGLIRAKSIFLTSAAPEFQSPVRDMRGSRILSVTKVAAMVRTTVAAAMKYQLAVGKTTIFGSNIWAAAWE
jgi:hypothetical protein